MLPLITKSRRKAAEAAPSAPVRLTAVVHTLPPVPTSLLPDSYALLGGGFGTSKPDPDVPYAEGTPNIFNWYAGSDEHQLVRIERITDRTWTDANGIEFNQVYNASVGASREQIELGNAVPFPSTNIDNMTLPGQYSVSIHLIYDTGFTESDSYTYSVAGVGETPGWYVPAPPPPPAVETVALNSLPVDAPQELKDTATNIAAAQVASTTTIGAAEAIWQSTGNVAAGVNAELDGYEAIGKAWLDLADMAMNDNIKRVATLNEDWVFTNLFSLAMNGHNSQSDATLAIVDANVVTYENYGAYAATATAENLKAITEAWM